MTIFLRLLPDRDKSSALARTCTALRQGQVDPQVFGANASLFTGIPGAAFAYWFSKELLASFQKLKSFEEVGHHACVTNQLGNDFRYYRAWWEVIELRTGKILWKPLAKGGAFSPYYSDVHLLVAWNEQNETYNGFVGTEHRPLERPASANHFGRPGLTWPRRTQQFGMRIMPEGCIFSNKGPGAFVQNNEANSILTLLGVSNSVAFKTLVSTRLNAGDSTARSFEVGVIQRTPMPEIPLEPGRTIAKLSLRAWSLKRASDTVDETSHAFVLPTALRVRLGDYDPPAIEAELAKIQEEIDEIAFDLYGFSEEDRAAALGTSGSTGEDDDDDEDSEEAADPVDLLDGLLSWCVGVAFGRFDWRLATGERETPVEPEPFDPLPAKSPGMLPDGAGPFHAHSGILVDDRGHPDDLAGIVEEVLAKVDDPVTVDVRRWLQRDFFPSHLKQYSKSRRKAPIYWPLSTASGSYTLWLYYPELNAQTLYTAVNDFIEPKLKQVSRDLASLRAKGSARSRDEEKSYEAFEEFEIELRELCDAILKIAPTYRPNHDDGVQITAAPLWSLFRHKPWQKVLKDTRKKLEKGDYDWAHLAMAYWPERVREKCKTDKSLAIAHDLEDLYEEPADKKAKGKAA